MIVWSFRYPNDRRRISPDSDRLYITKAECGRAIKLLCKYELIREPKEFRIVKLSLTEVKS